MAARPVARAQEAALPALAPQALQGLGAAAGAPLSPAQIQRAVEGMSPAEVQRLVQQAAGGGEGGQPAGDQATLSGQDASRGEDAAAAGQEDAVAAEQQRGRQRYSSLEQIYRRNYATPLAQGLTQFGYDFFRAGSAVPSRLAVPDDSYVLGPGDRLRIRVWGAGLDAEFTGAIDRNGNINVPKIGIVPLAGSRFGEAEQIIRREAEKYIQGINIHVSLAELRSIEIYVVGEVARPGLHLVPPFSTVLGGLANAGGVKKTGSLRRIRLVRNGKTAATLDLYDLLLRGDRKNDRLLTDRDIVFVPPIGPTAAVAGAVARPAIYELAGGETVADLIRLAGGELPQAFGERIYLRRFAGNREFVVRDIDAGRDPQVLAAEKVANGDLVELQYLGAAWPKVVRLEGHVWFPDVFAWRPGLRLSDILTSPELLRPDAVTGFAYLHRYDPATTRYLLRAIPLQQVFGHSFDLELAPHDRIQILSRKEIGIQEPVRVAGAVWRPGEFPWRPGLTVEGVLALAGGLRFGADTGRIDLSRQTIEDQEVVTTHYRIDAEKDKDFVLQPYDYLFVRQVKDATSFNEVTIEGEVRFPGVYRIKKGERLADLIERAGGFTDDAYFYGVRFFSATARLVQQQSLDRLIDDLQVRAETVLADQVQTAGGEQDAASLAAARTALQRLVERLRRIKASGRVALQVADLASLRASDQNVALEHGDRLVVPKRPEFVSVVGSVYTPNSFLYQPRFTVADYLAQAGGPTRDADEKHVYVLKANGEVAARSQQGMFSSSFLNMRLMPGDTVVVPAKLERIPYLLVTRDIADILFKIATTAGVALAL